MNYLPDPELVATDKQLSDRALRVYLILARRLDPIAYRPIKVSWVAWVLKFHRADASRALSLLVRRGYLDRNGKNDRGVWTYRIVPTPPDGTKTPPSRAA